jgi:hypothetical protein
MSRDHTSQSTSSPVGAGGSSSHLSATGASSGDEDSNPLRLRVGRGHTVVDRGRSAAHLDRGARSIVDVGIVSKSLIARQALVSDFVTVDRDPEERRSCSLLRFLNVCERLQTTNVCDSSRSADLHATRRPRRLRRAHAYVYVHGAGSSSSILQLQCIRICSSCACCRSGSARATAVDPRFMIMRPRVRVYVRSRCICRLHAARELKL